MKSKLRKIAEGIPYLFLLIAFILIISLIVSLEKGKTPTIFGRAIFIVVSPSMEDTIMSGDIIFVDTTPDHLGIGDIISFHKPNEQDIIITHRIVDMEIVNGTTYYTTKGDNNSETLDWETHFDESLVVGKYVGKSGAIGSIYNFVFANGFNLIFVIIIGVFVIIGGMEVFNIIKQLSMAKEKERLEEKERMIQEELARLRAEQEEKE